MRSLIVVLLLCLFLLPATAQQHADCIDAHVLAPTPTNLSALNSITIDALITSGSAPSEWFVDSEDQCGTERTFISRPEDKHYWFVFSAETSGSLEFMITPESPGTTYDFALWKGGCPNDVICSELFYCAWGVGNIICDEYPPTGVSLDPLGTFNVVPNLTTYLETIELKAGENYYLLVQNTDESDSNTNICVKEPDSLGFTIEFNGTATIGPEIVYEPPSPLTPLPITDTLHLCEGDVQTFTVSEVMNASNYDWFSQTTLADANISILDDIGNSVSVEMGSTSGQVCMEITCPIQTRLCWQVQVDKVPDLEAIPSLETACEPVNLADRFQDNKNVAAPVAFYETEVDAIAGTSPMSSSIVNTSGSYWARKTTLNGCSDIVEINVSVENIKIAVADTLSVCNRNFINFREALEIEDVNGIGDLIYFFFEDSLDAVNRTNPFTPPTAFDNGTYWVRAESQAGGFCYDLVPFEVVFENAPELAPIPDQNLCGNTCFQTSDLNLMTLDGQAITGLTLHFYANEADAQAGDEENALGIEICTSGTYWVRAASSMTCFAVSPFNLSLQTTPDIDDLTLNLDCAVGCIDLASEPIIEKNGINPSDLQIAYYASLDDAENANAVALANLNICSPTEVWAKITHITSGCSDIAQISIVGMPLAQGTVSGTQTICAGETAVIDVTLSGQAPYQLTFSDGSTTFDTIANNSNFSLPVHPDSTATYTLVGLMDGQGCLGTSNGTADITVNHSPVIDNLSQNCNANATEFQLSFDIIGSSTYQVQGISGTLTGNAFVSDFLPSGSTVTFEIIGKDDCPNTQLSFTFSCECNSAVGEMDLMPIQVCDRQPAIGTYLGSDSEVLEKEDSRFFVLHDNPINIISNLIAYSEVPVFSFDANTMQYGTTYYISAVVTKTDLIGNPIFNSTNNPCISVSTGVPVTYYPVPSVHLSLTQNSICQGETVDLTFNIEGVGPYDVVYFDGEKLSDLMGIKDGHTLALSPQFSTSFYVTSISQSGISSCAAMLMPIDNEILLTVNAPPTLQNIQTICNENATKAVVTFEILGGDASSYSVYTENNFLSGTINGNTFTSDSVAANTFVQFGITDNQQCIPALSGNLDGSKGFYSGMADCLCTPDISVAINTIKGVSCRGEKDAILRAEPVNGKAPYTYYWSTGEANQQVTNIAPGETTVTMTDVNGCEVSNIVMLEEPTSLTASTNVLNPSCFGSQDGVLLLVQVEGGAGNYSYSFDGRSFQSEPIYEGFSAGVYTIAVQDENGCEWMEEATLQNPPQLDVVLGANRVLNLGETTTLTPQVNQEIISTIWESQDTSLCMDCTSQEISPASSYRYKVTVTNTAGCTASDEILVQVKNDQRIYIPNVFSPNGDGRNDLLRPYSSSEVQDVPMFRVFNRWGELIYEKEDMDTSIASEGWDGFTLTGNKAPTGIYLYYAEVLFKNGNSAIVTGDVSLVR